MADSDSSEADLDRSLKGSHSFAVTLDPEEHAAIEGWRQANNISTLSEAARVLLRLGLLGEISKVYGVVSAVRRSVGEETDGQFACKAHGRHN